MTWNTTKFPKDGESVLLKANGCRFFIGYRKDNTWMVRREPYGEQFKKFPKTAGYIEAWAHLPTEGWQTDSLPQEGSRVVCNTAEGLRVGFYIHGFSTLRATDGVTYPIDNVWAFSDFADSYPHSNLVREEWNYPHDLLSLQYVWTSSGVDRWIPLELTNYELEMQSYPAGV